MEITRAALCSMSVQRAEIGPVCSRTMAEYRKQSRWYWESGLLKRQLADHLRTGLQVLRRHSKGTVVLDMRLFDETANAVGPTQRAMKERIY